MTAAARLEGSALEIREKIQSLWTRLNVPEEEQMAFNQAHLGHKPRVIAMVSCVIVTCCFDDLYPLQCIVGDLYQLRVYTVHLLLTMCMPFYTYFSFS